MMRDLSGKVAVVTGAASGIGKAIARALIAEGMQLVVSDIEADRLQATADEIGALAIVADVSNPDDVAALARQALDRFGAVHLVCNNAGIGPMAPLAELTLQDWRWMIDVNLWGVIHGVTAFLPILRANADGGHIVNTASMAGLMPVPTLVAYCTSKYAIVGLSEAMALDLAAEGSRIGVSILCPGPVRSELGTSTRNRPDALSGGLRDVDLEASVQFEGQAVDWLSAEATAALVIDGILADRLYIVTHPDMLADLQARHRPLEAAFVAAKAVQAPVQAGAQAGEQT
jgi:NAD(P)-dependent dehydrogenase (short-subunit alcohol dehydrogenase family)